MGHEILFEPVSIGAVDIKNRLALAPTNNLFSINGIAGDRSLGFYAARAKGGLGLIIFEATFVNDEPFDTPTPCLWAQWHMPGLATVARAVHSYGAKIFIQLSPGSGVQGCYSGLWGATKAPSPIPVRGKVTDLPETLLNRYLKNPRMIKVADYDVEGPVGYTPIEITEEEIEERIQAFAKACRLAILAGFDGVELHACHGWLIHNFLSPRYNKRTDSWGGSLENRMRFLMRLIEVSKDVLVDDFALGVRLSMDERNEDGIHLDEMVKVAAACEKAGADYLHLSDGCIEQCKYFLPEEDGSMIEGAVAFKAATDLPVITPNLHDPDLAEETLRDGKTDVVSSSRVFMADPEWANKVREERIADIRKCTRCNLCIFEFECNRPIRCAVNKKLGFEWLELKDLIKY